MTLDAIIEEARTLSIEERKQLISALVDTLAESHPTPKHSILELDGLGKELWEGIDPQTYINELRDEWDHRP
jgi:hypothetical protein